MPKSHPYQFTIRRLLALITETAVSLGLVMGAYRATGLAKVFLSLVALGVILAIMCGPMTYALLFDVHRRRRAIEESRLRILEEARKAAKDAKQARPEEPPRIS